jgi:hypothetical protein
MREWQQAGVFDRLQQAVLHRLDRLGQQGRPDWAHAGPVS